MRKLIGYLALVAALSAAEIVTAEEITYELYSLGPNSRTLLAAGTRTYRESDFETEAIEGESQSPMIRKELEIVRGFSIGLSDRLESRVDGFGLWVGHLPVGSNPNDFSWEWYDTCGNGRFRKRQGRTNVQVAFTGLPLVQEIRTITFIEDTELRYIQDLSHLPKGQKRTHVLVVKAGSVLKFPVRHDS